MERVERFRDFPKGCFTNQFLGKNLDEALKWAEYWRTQRGVSLSHYFVQRPLKKTSKLVSILVAY